MAAITADERERRDRTSLLDITEALMYEKGIQAVGMQEIRAAARLPLKRIYALYPSKEQLVVDMLRRRDARWRGALASYVEAVDNSRERVLAIFDWLQAWFSEPGFRGCFWINAYGELGSTHPAVLAEVRSHKAAFRAQVHTWVSAVAPPAAESVYLLAEGAIVSAGVTGQRATATYARRAAEILIDLPHDGAISLAAPFDPA